MLEYRLSPPVSSSIRVAFSHPSPTSVALRTTARQSGRARRAGGATGTKSSSWPHQRQAPPQTPSAASTLALHSSAQATPEVNSSRTVASRTSLHLS